MTAFEWPDDLRPRACPVHTVNTLDVAAAPARAWAWLVRAALWPDWYPHARDLVLHDHPGPDLAPGVRFSWTTLGVVRVHTTVERFEPARLLAWRGTGLGAEGWHAWRIDPAPHGCRVITEEVQRGLAPALLRPLLRPSLLAAHQRWLEGLARLATLAPPV